MIRGQGDTGQSPLEAIDVDRLLGLPEPCGFCGHGGLAHLRKKGDRGAQRVTRLSCRSWLCRVCGARKLRALALHFADRLVMADGSLSEMDSDPFEWKAKQEWLRRAGASWVRIGPRKGYGVVFVCRPIPFGRPINDAAEAVRLVGRAFVEVEMPRSAGVRRFSCSDDWTPPRKEHRYERVQLLRGLRDSAAVVRALEALGIRCRVRPRVGDDGVEFDVAFRVPEGLEDAVRSALSGSVGTPKVGVALL